jgi:hypothetical protein
VFPYCITKDVVAQMKAVEPENIYEAILKLYLVSAVCIIELLLLTAFLQ